MDFKEFATDDEIPLILSDYNINDAYIEVVPFQHNLSSYLWDYIEDDAVGESEYLRTLIGLSSIYDNSLKTFNATVVEVGRDGIVVEPFENETEKINGFNQISLEGIYRNINSKIRVVYDGRIIADHSTYPYIITISSVIAVYNVTGEKEKAKIVNIDIDKKELESNTVFGYQFDEELFLKEMQEYGAKVNQSADGESYNLVFSESQYNNLLKDKYNQIATIYSGYEYLDTYQVIREVEFDEDFRNLKIYIDKEMWEVMAYDCTEGVASQAYSYQMFLEDGIGVDVEVINYKTNKVYYSYTLPRDY